MRVAVINGPNLNLLGVREPEIYGRTTLAEIEATLQNVARELDVELICVQRNGEGELIDAIHAARESADGLIVNAGAYTHTSIALRDALVGIGRPYVEIHLTNTQGREKERWRSYLARDAAATIAGFGAYGYELAFRGLVRLLGARG